MTDSPAALRLATPAGEVSALLDRPADPFALLVLAHGAGADMHHRFMADVAAALAERGMAVLRYQFPYTDKGLRRPDPQPRCVATVRAAVAEGARLAAGLPVLAGGKSMGGRMTTHAAVDGGLAPARGLVLLCFPLHKAKAPSVARAEHLPRVDLPTLWVQGTRDELAALPLLEPVVRGLGPRAHLHVVEDADHGFAVRKTRGHDPARVIPGIADVVVGWARQRLGPEGTRPRAGGHAGPDGPSCAP